MHSVLLCGDYTPHYVVQNGGTKDKHQWVSFIKPEFICKLFNGAVEEKMKNIAWVKRVIWYGVMPKLPS